jgi:transcriptional regulator with XRE-family HTH domain
MATVGERIKEARKAKKLTQTELGAMLGFKKSAISAWETGQNKPDSEDVERLCGALGVSPTWLLGVDMTRVELSPAEEQHIRQLRRLSAYQKELIGKMMEQMLGGE